MKSLLEILQASTAFLEKKGIAHPKRQAEDMIADALGLNRLQLYLQFDRPLNDKELEICRERLVRRSKGEPLAYISGSVEFYNCTIKLTNDVLIPRPETEILVDKLAHILANKSLTDVTLWDICTGSGCIGIALKKKFPELQVTLSDLSPSALHVAAENAQLNEVDLRLLQGDLLEPFKNEKAHIVVCNPPYISQSEYEKLDREVSHFEPKMALLGGEQGTEFYERLERTLPSHLHSGALVAFEIGYMQGEALQRIFGGKPWNARRVEKDWAGHFRFFFLENE